MHQSAFRMTVAGMLGLIAGVALNIWLFRQGALWGILGLNVSKHVLIAYLCQATGLNRQSSLKRPAIGADPNSRRHESLSQPA